MSQPPPYGQPPQAPQPPRPYQPHSQPQGAPGYYVPPAQDGNTDTKTIGLLVFLMILGTVLTQGMMWLVYVGGFYGVGRWASLIFEIAILVMPILIAVKLKNNKFKVITIILCCVAILSKLFTQFAMPYFFY